MSFGSKTASIFHWIMYHCHQSNHQKMDHPSNHPYSPTISASLWMDRNSKLHFSSPKCFHFFQKKQNIQPTVTIQPSTPTIDSTFVQKFLPFLVGAHTLLRGFVALLRMLLIQRCKCEWIEGGKTRWLFNNGYGYVKCLNEWGKVQLLSCI